MVRNDNGYPEMSGVESSQRAISRRSARADALHLHPLNYAVGLASAAVERGVRIHENSAVAGLERMDSRWRLRAAQGVVLAEGVLACGGYLVGLQLEID